MNYFNDFGLQEETNVAVTPCRAGCINVTPAPAVGAADSGGWINGESNRKSRRRGFSGLFHPSLPDFCDRNSFALLDIGNDVCEAEHQEFQEEVTHSDMSRSLVFIVVDSIVSILGDHI